MENKYKVGLLLVTLSAVTFSTAGLFVKGVSADPYAIVFWRSIGAIIAVVVYSQYRAELRQEIKDYGPSAFAVSVVGAWNAGLYTSFQTDVYRERLYDLRGGAFFSALIAYIWMSERPKRAVHWSSAIVVFGVALIVSGSSKEGNLAGDMLVLIMTIAMALVVCIYRRYPQTPARSPAAAMALLLIPAGLMFDTPFSLPTTEILLCLLFGIVFAVASVSLAEGACRLPAAQTSLLTARSRTGAVARVCWFEEDFRPD